MTSEDSDESMARFDHRRPIPTPIAPSSPAMKPKGGARLLSFILRAVVMAVALALFFLFAGIAVLLLLLLCVVGRVLRRRRRRFFHNMIRPIPEESCGLSPDELRCLPCFRYFGGLEAADAIPMDCAVCLDRFRVREWCRALPGCNHLFHAICVDRWLEKSAICPICRGSVSVDVDDLDAGMPFVWI